MKILKFRRTSRNNKYEFGEVLVQDFFFFNRTLEVYKGGYSSHWKFVHNSKYTPGFQLERLVDSYDAQESRNENSN